MRKKTQKTSNTVHIDGIAAVGDNASTSVSVSGNNITLTQQISASSQDNDSPEERSSPLKRKVSHHVGLPVVDQLLSRAADPNISFMSVSGPVSSGKTCVLDSFYRRYGEYELLRCAKVIKINENNENNPTSLDWVSAQILITLGHQIPEESKHVEAKYRLSEYISRHRMVILVFDISIIPKHPLYGQPLMRFLYDIIQSESQNSGRVKIVVSSLCSLSKTKLFDDLGEHASEVVVEEIPLESALNLIFDVNKDFPKKYAEFLCMHYERSPLVLKRIAKIDVTKVLEVPPDDEVEFKKAFEIKEDQLTKDLCADDENRQHIVAILKSLGYEERRLIIQCRVFPFEFDRERASLIVDPDISVTLPALEKFGVRGLMLLKSRMCKKSNRVLFHFRKVVGELIRNVILEDNSLRRIYDTAEERFCELYFKLLSFLSNSFSGNATARSDELNVLGPLTPYDGVPDSFALTRQSKHTKAKLTIQLFRRHQPEIIRALKQCVRHEKLHCIALNLATQMPVLTLLNKMLLLHHQLAIYRRMKRISRKSKVFEAKVNVCLAYFLMYAFGFQRYCTEARSLLEGALTTLKEHKDTTGDIDSYANCLSKLGRCLSSEIDVGQEQVNIGIENITIGASLWSLKEEKTTADEVLLAACWRHLAGVHHQIGQPCQAEQLIKNRVLPIYEKYLGRHPYTATAWNTLGVVYQKMNNVKDAKQYLLKALQLRRELLGDHEDTMRSLHALGSLLLQCASAAKPKEKVDLLQEARSYFEEAGEMGLRAIGHMEDTAGSFREVANTCRLLGKLEEAKLYQAKADKILRKFYDVKKGIVSGTLMS